MVHSPCYRRGLEPGLHLVHGSEGHAERGLKVDVVGGVAHSGVAAHVVRVTMRQTLLECNMREMHDGKAQTFYIHNIHQTLSIFYEKELSYF